MVKKAMLNANGDSIKALTSTPNIMQYNNCATCGKGMVEGKNSYDINKPTCTKVISSTDARQNEKDCDPKKFNRLYDQCEKAITDTPVQVNQILGTEKVCVPHDCVLEMVYGECDAKCNGKVPKMEGFKTYTINVKSPAKRGGKACEVPGQEKCTIECVVDKDCEVDKKVLSKDCQGPLKGCDRAKPGQMGQGTRSWHANIKSPKVGNGKDCVTDGVDTVNDCPCPVDCDLLDVYGECDWNVDPYLVYKKKYLVNLPLMKRIGWKKRPILITGKKIFPFGLRNSTKNLLLAI